MPRACPVEVHGWVYPRACQRDPPRGKPVASKKNGERPNSVRHSSCCGPMLGLIFPAGHFFCRFGTLSAVLPFASPSFCRFGSWAAETADGSETPATDQGQGPQRTQVLQAPWVLARPLARSRHGTRPRRQSASVLRPVCLLALVVLLQSRRQELTQHPAGQHTR